MDAVSTLWELDTLESANDYLASHGSNAPRLQHFIDGSFGRHSEPVEWIESLNPRSGRLLAQIPSGTVTDVDRAVDAASIAFLTWSKTSRQERSQVLMRISDILGEKKELFAVWESIDQGEDTGSGQGRVVDRLFSLRYFATYILHEEGAVRYVDGQPSTLTYEHRSPVGVFGLISPWNMPLYLLTWKIAPCLAFGCTGVAKPSEVTSITAFLLGEVFRQAKLPAGVMNLVFGDGPGTGSALVKSSRVRGVSFTGGTNTGIRIRQDTVADIGKHLSLELGGKNPVLVFDDVDLTKAVPLAARAAFENSGQVCLCGSRIYVQRAVYAKFLSALVEYVESNYKLGETMGPVVSREHYLKIRGYLVQAQEENAVFHTGDVPDEEPQQGFWITPTVLTNLPTGSRVMREEIFGPVVTVCPFGTEEEAIALANDNPNGLAGIVMTNNLARMRRVGERIDAGLIWVNCWLVRELGTGFGGMKASGTGREGGAHSRDVFTNLRTLHVSHF
ncbi:uncharacterized protein N7525_008681 [Penicillium rubens]|uniref:uncharacterized protein n=1 Tax=Penicillium rubens TaxID=1108849 RepID=UPI002A5AD866|nr:uncharacterized protein N7525_008681 [Penicillium rubens]KAJ5830428.1 hypothetical protein N7525_008681 [Penicillium rubens]